MVVLLLLVFIAIIVSHVPELVRARLWKEIVVFFVLLTLGIIYSFGQIYDWSLPNPTKHMEYMFEPIYKALKKLLS